MNIDSILTEWSYRLPSGYPTKSKDYELLYHVILEMTDVTPLVAQKIDRALTLAERLDALLEQIEREAEQQANKNVIKPL